MKSKWEYASFYIVTAMIVATVWLLLWLLLYVDNVICSHQSSAAITNHTELVDWHMMTEAFFLKRLMHCLKRKFTLKLQKKKFKCDQKKI